MLIDGGGLEEKNPPRCFNEEPLKIPRAKLSLRLNFLAWNTNKEIPRLKKDLAIVLFALSNPRKIALAKKFFEPEPRSHAFWESLRFRLSDISHETWRARLLTQFPLWFKSYTKVKRKKTFPLLSDERSKMWNFLKKS